MKTKAIINKEEFLGTLFCPRFGWILKHSPPEVPQSPSEQLRIDQGLDIHNRARNLFPEGIMVTGDNISSAKKTQKLLSDPNTTVIFEATFIWEEFIAKADILIRDKSKWKIIEVKSDANDDNKLVDDLSYTTFVALSSMLPISTCSLLLVNKEYRLGMSDENLFIEIDHTDDAFARAGEFKELSKDIAQILSGSHKPDPELKWECKDCDIFEDCCGVGVGNHIFDLPRLSHTKFCQLRDMGALNIESIPADFKLTDVQAKIRQAVVTGEPVINPKGLRKAIDLIAYPAYFLDFETTQTCIPLYEGIAPYSQLPTQYSIHICNESEVIGHREYLADPELNCSRILAENLIRDCGSTGSIIVYTSFEKTIINGLAGTFPDLSDELNGLLNRLVDLCDIIRKNYYHPGFHGSFSIKKVLPVVAPDMGYKGMVIDNGMDASALFAYMAMGKYDAEEVKKIRANLLDYCGLDTLAMAKVLEWLRRIV